MSTFYWACVEAGRKTEKIYWSSQAPWLFLQVSCSVFPREVQVMLVWLLSVSAFDSISILMERKSSSLHAAPAPHFPAPCSRQSSALYCGPAPGLTPRPRPVSPPTSALNPPSAPQSPPSARFPCSLCPTRSLCKRACFTR